MAFNPAEGWYPNKGDTITSPKIACEPWRYYRLSFSSKASEPCYWSVFFQDANGNDIVDDVYARVYRSDDWVPNTGIVRGREDSRSLTIRFSANGSLDVKDIVLEEISVRDAALWADELYASLSPLTYNAPLDRCSHIPNALRTLSTGGTLRIIMLGDSIINDTNNSNYEILLARHYPNAVIHVSASVRGSTGCWYYQEPEYFRSYVIDKKPDLLMIGGISHRSEIDPIRNVIRMTKEMIGCEILLMSGPVGKDWRIFDTEGVPAPPGQTWTPDPFNNALRSLAHDEKIEYFDIGGAWHEDLGASKKPFEYFHRDAVHADDRGKQVLARLMERYLSPR